MEMYLLARFGMANPDIGSMEEEPAFLMLTIKAIAQDRIVETLLVGTVHAQLMGAPRLRIEGNAGMSVALSQQLIVCDCTLPFLSVHTLIRTVQRV